MKWFLALVLVTGLTVAACSTISPVVCSVEQSVSVAVASGISSSLSCSNVSQIQSDLMAALGKANLCSAPTPAAQLKGVVGDIVCPIAVNAAMGLVANQIPSSWGCSPTATISGLTAVLVKACTAVVPI